MKKTDTYTQCLMRKGNSYRSGWIPTSFAKYFTTIDLKIDGKWSKGWNIMHVGITVNNIYVEIHETDYKRQRKASDI